MTPSKSDHLYIHIWTAKAQPSPLSMMAGCTRRDIWLPVGGLAKYIRGNQKITTTLGIFSTSLFLTCLLGILQAKYMIYMHNLFGISAKHDLKPLCLDFRQWWFSFENLKVCIQIWYKTLKLAGRRGLEGNICREHDKYAALCTCWLACVRGPSY